MKARLAVVMIVFVIGLGLATGCGKKAPPFVAKKEIHLRVQGLLAHWADKGVELQGAVVGPEHEKAELGTQVLLRIYQVRYPPEQSPCPGCPISYPGHVNETCGLDKQGRFSCFVPLKRQRGIYFFQVAVIGPSGSLGPLSEKAIVEVE